MLGQSVQQKCGKGFVIGTTERRLQPNYEQGSLLGGVRQSTTGQVGVHGLVCRMELALKLRDLRGGECIRTVVSGELRGTQRKSLNHHSISKKKLRQGKQAIKRTKKALLCETGGGMQPKKMMKTVEGGSRENGQENA